MGIFVFSIEMVHSQRNTHKQLHSIEENEGEKCNSDAVWNAKPVYASLWSFFEFMNVFQEKRNRKF